MLHDNATAQTLGMARIWIFGLAALSRFLTPVGDVCLLPDYQAAGIMRLLGTHSWVPLITPEMAFGIQALTIALLFLVAAGVGAFRVLAPLACLALVITEGLVRGNGVPTHANVILILSTCVLSCFPAADGLTLFPGKTRLTTPPVQYQAALISLSLVFCITYLFVAARRLSASGIDIYLDDSILSATALRDAELGQAGGLGKWMCESVLAAWAMRIGFPLVTLLELLTPLCLFSSRFRWIWMAVIIPFHIGAGLMMGIWFSYHLALIPVLIAGFDPFRRATGKLAVSVTSKAMKRAA